MDTTDWYTRAKEYCKELVLFRKARISGKVYYFSPETYLDIMKYDDWFPAFSYIVGENDLLTIFEEILHDEN